MTMLANHFFITVSHAYTVTVPVMCDCLTAAVLTVRVAAVFGMCGQHWLKDRMQILTRLFFFPAVWLNPSCGCSGLRYSQQIENVRFLYYKPFSRGWRYKRIEAVLYPADYQGQQVLLSAETLVFCTHPHFLVFWCSWAELNYCREVVLLLSNSKLFLCNAGRLIKKKALFPDGTFVFKVNLLSETTNTAAKMETQTNGMLHSSHICL